MKFFIVGALFISNATFAQNLDLNGLKQLLTSRKVTLEAIKQGMSKKLTTQAKVSSEVGVCDYKIISIQTVLKIEGEKIIIHSKDSFQPAATPSCSSLGYQPFEEKILFYEDKPSLAADLADLDISAPAIKSIVKQNETVTLFLEIFEQDTSTNTTYTDKVTVKYDLTKPSFKNLLINQGNEYTTLGEDQPDVNVQTIDLSNVLFCNNNDGDNSECAEGNFSDILFDF